MLDQLLLVFDLLDQLWILVIQPLEIDEMLVSVLWNCSALMHDRALVIRWNDA